MLSEPNRLLYQLPNRTQALRPTFRLGFGNSRQTTATAGRSTEAKNIFTMSNSVAFELPHRGETNAETFVPRKTARVSGASVPRAWPPSSGDGGAGRDRTDDLLLAKQALSQLSYGPKSYPFVVGPGIMVGPGRFELPTSRLSGVRSNQLSYGPPWHRRRAGRRPRVEPAVFRH